MELIRRINEIESRVRAINLTLSEFCNAAGVGKGLISKWKNQLHSPTHRVFEREMEKLDAALIAHELALRDYLIGLHGLPESGVRCQVSEVRQEEAAA